LARAAGRLAASVVRPLTAALGAHGPASGRNEITDDDLRAELNDLARDATRLRARVGGPPALLEATAALQDLACQLVAEDAETLAARRRELAELMVDAAPAIQSAPDGPYLVTNAPTLRDGLGLSLEPLPQLALCRCGASESKPFCDGSHAQIGFRGAKEPERVPDRVDRYDGQQIEVLDNRGTCAHSGFCTDRLPTVFRASEEPFVAPSGGRVDEIVRAARDCPSGALSYAVGGVEARRQVDQEREPAIEVSRDGPYRVSGAIALVDADGRPEPRNAGASLEHYSLCRCGQSRNKPFCTGMHWHVDFHDPEPAEQPTLFQWAGGFPALLRLTRRFYETYVAEDPLLAPLFARMSPDHPERVAAWLGEVFGGPRAYTERYGGYQRMIGQHMGKGLQEEWRARWVQLLTRAADDVGLPADPEFRAAFAAYLEWGSRIAVENSGPDAKPPPQMPVPRWWWVCDAYPWSRVAAMAPEEPVAEVALPGPDAELSYAEHVKPLFRRRDRDSMSFVFDLWSRDDVATHAEAILERLRAGTMPCDGAWPTERIAVLERWVAAGGPA
ncbi:MAG: hypothetical protein JWN32_1525, partial [Solirubrobacterales bacterium]|nr:hypothetical protein [Solirubrobacterales bacterium]